MPCAFLVTESFSNKFTLTNNFSACSEGELPKRRKFSKVKFCNSSTAPVNVALGTGFGATFSISIGFGTDLATTSTTCCLTTGTELGLETLGKTASSSFSVLTGASIDLSLID